MNPEKLSILVIDDFQNMRSTLRQMLLSLGFRTVVPVANGKEALRELRLRRYDIVICDYNLGDGIIDGQQVLDQARLEGLIDLATVFVMVTAENSSEMVMGALESVPDAYLSKPLTKDLLHGRLARAVRRRMPFAAVAQRLAKDGVDAALAVLDQLLQQPSSGQLDLLRTQAELAFSANRLDIAETAARAALAERPLAWALTLVGQVRAARGIFDEAEALYRRSMSLTPQYMPAHDQLAALCDAQGRHDEALEILQAAIQRSPKSLSRQRALARLALRLGQTELAETAWTKALALAKQIGAPQATDHFGLVQTLLAHQDPARARRVAQELQKNCRQDPQTPWWSLAARLRCLDGEDSARATLMAELDAQMSESSPPEDVKAALIEVLQALGETARAIQLNQESSP